jgi:PST family polysaccharide transporter
VKVVQKIFASATAQSALWHAGPRILRVGSGIIASVVVARHLGPENFGILSFATMLATLAAGLVQLGSLEVISKNAAIHPEKMHSLLRSAIQMRLWGALLSAVVISVLPVWFGHQALYLILAILPLTWVPDYVEAAFYGRSEFRTLAPVRVFSSLLGMGLRLYLATHDKPIEAFAMVTVIEGGTTALLFLWFRKKIPGGNLPQAPFPCSLLFRQSMPLVASSMVVAVMLKLDQFLLQALLPGEDVGYYYVVVRLFEMAGVLIPSLIAVLLPELARLRAASEQAYAQKMAFIYRRTYQLGLLAAAFGAVVAPWLIPFLFGASYAPAVPIFAAYAFMFPSLLVGSVRAMEFVISNKNINHLLVSLLLLPLQLGFCGLGIHWFGPTGLAAAMVVVGFISTTVFSLILPPLRESGVLQRKALSDLLRWGAA